MKPKADSIPTVTGSGTVEIFGVTFNVHQLDNGERVIEGADVARLFDAMANHQGPPPTETELAEFARLVMAS